jgi:hypothetical protein
MRKRVVAPISQQAPAWDEGWLNLDNLASVEVTSEDALIVQSIWRFWHGKSEAGGRLSREVRRYC